ncbi:Uncharacterized protein TCM_045280 [Theobroma cacao]|uniref:RNase H type-1 domain-containing protein n=1 Tax=Theobroma cacao TaxID=3641 RepID=A0A061FRD7_THECC|nr:Uncharacterized protein TCM_045280 [Theobroma cacao]
MFSVPACIYASCSKQNSRKKSNVDGAARGCPSPSSMGGAMRDHEIRVKILFSKPPGHGDSNVTEILAIKDAFYLFATSLWCSTHSLIVESDSSNFVF